MKRILLFLNPLHPLGGILGRVSGPLTSVTLAVLVALLLIPGSPLRPGTEFAKGEAGLAGELTARDQQAASVGAAVDYGTPGSYLAANSISYSYLVATVPNFGYPTGTHGQNQPVAIVLHVAGGSCTGMRNWFQNPTAFASSQFGICNDGRVEQYTSINDAAYTQGLVNKPSPYVAIFGGINPNLRAVSIELEGCGSGDNAPLSAKPTQEASLRLLLAWLSDTLAIPLDRAHVPGHFDIDGVNRASDPLCVIPDYDGFIASLKPPSGGVGAEPSGVSRTEFERFISDVNAFNVGIGAKVDTLIQKLQAQPTPAPVVAGITVYQIGQGLYTFDGGAWHHIASPATLDTLGPYRVVQVAADSPLLGLPVYYSFVPGQLR